MNVIPQSPPLYAVMEDGDEFDIGLIIGWTDMADEARSSNSFHEFDAVVVPYGVKHERAWAFASTKGIVSVMFATLEEAQQLVNSWKSEE